MFFGYILIAILVILELIPPSLTSKVMVAFVGSFLIIICKAFLLRRQIEEGEIDDVERIKQKIKEIRV